MYDFVGDELVAAGIAVELEEPVWMNALGKIVAEELSFGCKVSHNIIHPEYGIVLDEVGSNTDQKGGGNIWLGIIDV